MAILENLILKFVSRGTYLHKMDKPHKISVKQRINIKYSTFSANCPYRKFSKQLLCELRSMIHDMSVQMQIVLSTSINFCCN